MKGSGILLIYSCQYFIWNRFCHVIAQVMTILNCEPGMQCNCMMGLFPSIERAWLTIDSDIFVWRYEDG